MEQYKAKLRLTRWIAAPAAGILAAVSILGFLSEAGLFELTPIRGGSHWQSMWRGMISGASAGLAVLMLIGLVRITKALNDENALRKLYVKDNDERQIQIWTLARASSMRIFLIAGLAAGMAAGYFSMTVSITILACVFIHALLGGACKLYYSRKF